MKRKNIKNLLLTAAFGLGVGIASTSSMAWTACDEQRYQCFVNGGTLDTCSAVYYRCLGY